MKKIHKLVNQFKHYEWGSASFIPQFLNLNQDGIPYAEMWMVTHNSAASKIENNGNLVNLEEISGELPFLFKMLAVDKPLSVQVHPDKQQAETGFEAENAAGLSLDDPRRNYKDSNKKCEIICAITPFTLMAGFKEPEMIIASFGEYSPEQEKMIDTLESIYPHDTAVYSPLYFNLITLEPGQAVFIPCGVPHAYISGFGLELMNNSDNVIRGGLTKKHVDIDELMKVLNSNPYLPQVITPDSSSRFCYPIPCDDFSLSLIRSKGEPLAFHQTAPSICIVTEGELCIDNMRFKKGDSFFTAKDDNEILFKGDFSVYAASASFAPSSNHQFEARADSFGSNA